MVGQRTLNPSVGVQIPAPQHYWPVRLTVRTQDSQSCNRGSIPLRATKNMRPWLNWIEHLATDQGIGGSNPPGRTIIGENCE